MRHFLSPLAWPLWLALSACSGLVEEPLLGPGSSGSGAGAQPGATGSGGSGGNGGNGGTAAPFVAFASLARRHSRSELDNTLRDLLGDDTAPASRLLTEDEFSPYDNDYTGQQASQALVDSLAALAEDVAERALRDPARRAALVPCAPASAGDEKCFRTVVARLGERAFRRPLAPAEIDAYVPLLSFATEQNTSVSHDFYTAVSLFVRAVLQDPEFLYRIEVGSEHTRPDVNKLSEYEIATRLSYLLWGSTPDAALLASAAGGKLTAAATRRTEAERLLRDPRARAQLARFHAMWLGYRAIPQTAELAAAFSRETSALLERVIFDERRDYLDLFRLEQTYLDGPLADHYGLPRPSAASGWVSYGASGRAGILSHGSVLSAFSKFSDTSPTQRGIFIRTRLLCQSVGSAPASVQVDQPPASPDSPCKAARYAAHASGSCAGCHRQIDPIGFGLERFDIAGRYREHDDGLAQCAIEGKGELPGVGTFSGPAELGKLLIESGQLEPCVVRQYLSFALGRTLGASDTKGVEALTRSFSDHQQDFLGLVLDLILSDAFIQKKEPA